MSTRRLSDEYNILPLSCIRYPCCSRFFRTTQLFCTRLRRGGGMADAEDLKSSGPKGRAGSSPALGIVYKSLVSSWRQASSGFIVNPSTAQTLRLHQLDYTSARWALLDISASRIARARQNSSSIRDRVSDALRWRLPTSTTQAPPRFDSNREGHCVIGGHPASQIADFKFQISSTPSTVLPRDLR